MGLCKGDGETYVVNNFTRNYFDKDAVIQQQLMEHYNAAIQIFGIQKVLGVWLQGSQNYKLDYAGSDVDTKCIIIPSIDDIVLNKKPISTTHIMANESHLDLKDIKLYWECFRKQNVNFVEILYTDYYIINKDYEDLWNIMLTNRERIVRYCEYKAVKSMKGQAMEKYHALERPYPCQAEEVTQYKYASKQLHHLLRIQYFIEQYIAGKKYKTCLVPPLATRTELISVKSTPGLFTPEQARHIAETALNNITKIADDFCEKNELKCDEEVEKLLNDVLTQIIKRNLKKELF